jgi:UDP-2,4-diacetamido-2,4,6-trideoxy-beta-L-altropyranose hydrolase
MRVVFRVDASLKIGTGHVIRCLTLAQALKENGANVEFICREHKGSLIDKISLSGFNVYKLKVFKEIEVDDKFEYSCWLGVTQQHDANDCVGILKSEKINWLIVDHYSLDEEWHKRLRPYCEKLMVIDDLADRKYQCDILLDQTFGRQKENYYKLTPKDCILLLGSQYALLRPEFYKWRAYSLERRNKLKFKKLLINMGGVDLDNIIENILDELKVCDLPSDTSITVVMGGTAPHIESVKLKADALSFKTEVRVDVDNMAEIMANADIAIGAAGSSTWERCCLGLPTIQMVIAENQKTIAKYLEDNNAVILAEDISKIQGIVGGYNIWIKGVSESARQITDGLGSIRVVNLIINN